jgi:hypothetical protein
MCRIWMRLRWTNCSVKRHSVSVRINAQPVKGGGNDCLPSKRVSSPFMTTCRY